MRPFDGVYYKTCYYNPLFSVLLWWGGSILPFVANDFFHYALRGPNAAFRLDVDNFRTRDEGDILGECGVHVAHAAPSNGQALIATLTCHLESGGAAMVPVDRFDYAAPSNTYYRRTPLAHWALVYSRRGECFDTVEVNAKVCSAGECPVWAMWEGYRGYVSRYGDRPMQLISQIRSKSVGLATARSHFLEAMNSGTVSTGRNVEAIWVAKRELDGINEHLGSDVLRGERLKDFERRFFRWRRGKDVEHYQIGTFFGTLGSDLRKMNRETYERAGHLAAIIGRAVRRGKARGPISSHGVDLLAAIAETESDYYRELDRLAERRRASVVG